MKLLENIHAVRMLGKFQNYLLTIAANTCNNYFKKAKPIYTDLNTLDIADDTRSALERMIENENTAEVRKALLSLPDYQKEVIILLLLPQLENTGDCKNHKVKYSHRKIKAKTGIAKNRAIP